MAKLTPLGCLRCFFVFSVMFFSGIISFGVMVCNLPLRLISLYWFRKISTAILKIHYATFVYLLEGWGGIELLEYGVHIPYNTSAVALLNHRSNFDWLVAFAFGARVGVHGSLKVIIKDSLKYVPIFGWMQWMSEQIFIKRDWNTDQRLLSNTIKSMTKFPRPFWFCMYPEGTRLSAKSLQKSRDWAQKQYGFQLEHVLVPRVKAFIAAMDGFRDFIDVVYDATLVLDTEPSMYDVFSGQGNTRAHLHFHATKMADMPTTDDGIENWMIERYKVKDKLISDFYANGKKRLGPEPPLPRGPFPAHLYFNFWVVVEIFWLAGLYIYLPRWLLPSLSSFVGVSVTLMLLIVVAAWFNLKTNQHRNSKLAASAAAMKTSKTS